MLASEPQRDARKRPARPQGGPSRAEVGPARDPLEPVVVAGDARDAHRLVRPRSVDVVVTSPPYWKKRDYGHPAQLGQEATPQEYVSALVGTMNGWRPVLRSSGSVFLNVADSYRHRRLMGIPALLEAEAARHGWRLAHRILWAKNSGVPEAHERLASRHEFILHFSRGRRPYLDLFALAEACGNGANPGDVWTVGFTPTRRAHLAPYPEELARRMILLACPERVCATCGKAWRRQTVRGERLDLQRPQARRALTLYRERGLGPEHLAAIRATGLGDAGKALSIQDGSGKNSALVQQLAAEAKAALGGYFREFTFARPEHAGWLECGCDGGAFEPGLVLDPFSGTGTTLRAAQALGRRSVGVDLCPSV